MSVAEIAGGFTMPVLIGLGMQEILLIAGIVVLLFGATKLPQLMRGMGEGIKEFKHAVKDDEPEDKKLSDKNDSDSKS